MPVEPESTLRQGFWKRFAKSLDAGRQAYVADMKEVFGRPAIDAGFWDDLEATLIAADAGACVTERVIDQLRNQAAGAPLSSPAHALGYLKAAVLDAHVGQNSAQQVRVFQQAIGLTGLVVTKMDGSARAGVVLSIEAELSVPVKLVGIGEGLDDLNRFDPEQYLDALLRAEEGT